jgi:hypothetical protein
MSGEKSKDTKKPHGLRYAGLGQQRLSVILETAVGRLPASQESHEH